MSNENESPGGIVSDKYFFSNATEMELLFAGRFTENLKETEKRLGVTVTARDLCFRISSPQKENVVKTIAFLEKQILCRIAGDGKLREGKDLDALLCSASHHLYYPIAIEGRIRNPKNRGSCPDLYKSIVHITIVS